jgi:succinoglycan biosynthesis protein ExoH
MLRTIMIAGVVYVHAAADDRITGMGDGFSDYLMGFFNYAALRVPVPLLAIVSGYLLFSANLDLRPMTLWKKKAKTVGIPYLFFNVLAIALFFGLQHLVPDAIMHVDLLNASRYDWINSLLGIRDAPFDYPLYFLRDLMVMVILAPAFGLFIRFAPAVGLAIVIGLFYFNFDGYLIIRNTSAIMFYIGGLLAVKNVDLLSLDRYAASMLALFVTICAAVVIADIEDINYAVLTGPFLVWPAFKYLNNTKPGQKAIKASKYSFFVFIGHAPLLELLRIGYTKNLQDVVPYPVFWIAAPALVIMMQVVIYKAAMRATPMFFALVTGGRTDRKHVDKVDRRRAPRPASAPVYSNEFRTALTQP